MNQAILAVGEMESKLFKQGFNLIAGVDEAGRGCLAGPVVAGAVCVKKHRLGELLRRGVKDSKKLSPKRREKLSRFLTRNFPWAVGESSNQEIDKLGIKKATILAMARALNQLRVSPQYILLDGPWTLYQIGEESPLDKILISKKGVVNGDEQCLSVAAASIIAKVWRDNIMRHYHREFPQFDFSKHKGYGTQAHMRALETFSACRIHRRSFAPLKNKRS